MKKAADGPLRGILEYCDEPLVSIDFRGNPHYLIDPVSGALVADAIAALG